MHTTDKASKICALSLRTLKKSEHTFHNDLKESAQSAMSTPRYRAWSALGNKSPWGQISRASINLRAGCQCSPTHVRSRRRGSVEDDHRAVVFPSEVALVVDVVVQAAGNVPVQPRRGLGRGAQVSMSFRGSPTRQLGSSMGGC